MPCTSSPGTYIFDTHSLKMASLQVPVVETRNRHAEKHCRCHSCQAAQLPAMTSTLLAAQDKFTREMGRGWDALEITCCRRPAAKETLSSSDCALIGIPAELPALISQQRLYVAEFKATPLRQIAAAAEASAKVKKGSEVASKKDCGRPHNIPFAG